MFMNICLRDVICTSKDGERFWKLPECYIRGNSIKYLRIPDEIIDLVTEEEQSQRKAAFRGVRGGRSAGRLGGRGGDEGTGGGRGDGGGRGGRGDRGGGAGRGGRGGGRGGSREPSGRGRGPRGGR
mmetsp:Transcript_11359/g.17080  ORF Transcript_11359/g.17080 Transcript_11359/m.17080 type:complete len:126 (+) Transcript_11359:124-501(+)